MKKQKLDIKKGDVLMLGALSMGKNGDFMFMYKKFRLFLKNVDNKPIALSKLMKVKVVKLFDTLGYVELVEDLI